MKKRPPKTTYLASLCKHNSKKKLQKLPYSCVLLHLQVHTQGDGEKEEDDKEEKTYCTYTHKMSVLRFIAM
jgi:hypothetical protein